MAASGLDADVAASALTDVLWCAATPQTERCPNPECLPLAFCAARFFSRALALRHRRLLSVEYEGAEAAAASRAKLAEVTKEALRADATSKALLMERCEGEFLELVELIPSAAMYKKKEARSAAIACIGSWKRGLHARSLLQVRVNTKLVYNQQKYNLLREESEGYAKVLTVLNNFGTTALGESSAPDAVVALQSLIGCFDLDPNRVFDLVLDRRVQCRARLARHRHACVVWGWRGRLLCIPHSERRLAARWR